MAPNKLRRTFPPLITASRWETAWGSCFKAVLDAHGKAHAADGTLVPPLTNGEAVQLVLAWRAAAANGQVAFPLWSGFAAQAYGWSADNSVFDVSAAQRAKYYSVQWGRELWLTLQQLAYALDKSTRGDARLDFSATFDDPTVHGAVAADLASDGVAIRFKMKGGTVAPQVKPKPQPKGNALITIAWLYFGYRVLKNLTGGDKYTG